MTKTGVNGEELLKQILSAEADRIKEKDAQRELKRQAKVNERNREKEAKQLERQQEKEKKIKEKKGQAGSILTFVKPSK